MTEGEIVAIARHQYLFNPIFHAQANATVAVFEKGIGQLTPEQRGVSKQLAAIALVMKDIPIQTFLDG